MDVVNIRNAEGGRKYRDLAVCVLEAAIQIQLGVNKGTLAITVVTPSSENSGGIVQDLVLARFTPVSGHCGDCEERKCGKKLHDEGNEQKD